MPCLAKFYSRLIKMSSNFLPLDANAHRLHGWKRSDSYLFALADAVSPLLIAELSHAIGHYPVAFKARPDGGFQLIALLGMHEGENVFVDANGRWHSAYVPNHFRQYPFRLVRVQADDKQLTMLGFDLGSGLYREAPAAEREEQRFFDDEGQLHPWTQQLSHFLVESAKSVRITQQAVDALAAAKVLVPMALPKSESEDERPTLSGLYGISADALKALPGNVLEILRDVQALDLAYAQMFSMLRLKDLGHLAKLRAQQKAKRKLTAGLDSILGNAKQEEILDLEWLKGFK